MIYNFYLDFLCKKAEGLEPLRFFSFFIPLFLQFSPIEFCSAFPQNRMFQEENGSWCYYLLFDLLQMCIFSAS